MNPCPNCGWMLKDTDARCSMCGHQLGGAAARPPAPQPAAPASPYAAPAPPPPAYPNYPAPAYPQAPAYPPPGYPAPPPPVPGGAYAQAPAPPPPPPPQPSAPTPFSRGAGAAVSPWASPGGPPMAAPMPAPSPHAGPPPAGMAPAGMAPAGLGFAGSSPVAMPAPPPPAPPPPAPPPPIPSPYGPAIVPPMVSAGSLNGPPPAVTSDRVEARPIADAGGAPVLIGFLVTFQNEPTGKFWPLRSGRTALGRLGVDNEADVALPDASASARHAVVQGDPNTGQAFVEDAGSRNGTFINEQKIDKGVQRQLHDNDRLRLGSITLVVKLLASS